MVLLGWKYLEPATTEALTSQEKALPFFGQDLSPKRGHDEYQIGEPELARPFGFSTSFPSSTILGVPTLT